MMKCHQVVWARQSGAWSPAVVIDPSDKRWRAELKNLGSRRMSEHFVLLLGQGRINKTEESDIRDFCVHFKQCFSRIEKSPQSLNAIEVLVQLAAVRAGLPDPGNNWKAWAENTLHEFKDLTVGEKFYEAAASTDDQSEEPVLRLSHSKPSSSRENKEAPGRRGKEVEELEIVWAMAGMNCRFWPAVVLPTDRWPKGKIRVLVLSKVRRLFDIEFGAVFSFGPYFCSKFDESCIAADEPYYRMAVKIVVRMLYKNESDGEKWLHWARKNIAKHPKFHMEKEVFEEEVEHALPPPPPTRPVCSREPEEEEQETVDEAATTHKSTDTLFGTQPQEPSPEEAVGSSRESSGGTEQIHLKSPKSSPSTTSPASRSFITRRKKTPSQSSVKKSPKKLSPSRGDGTPSSSTTTEAGTSDRKKKIRFSTAPRLELVMVPLDFGWRRQLVLRKPGSVKYGDIYYYPPSGGRKLRSMPDILKYLEENNPHDLKPEHFSFKDDFKTGHEDVTAAR